MFVLCAGVPMWRRPSSNGTSCGVKQDRNLVGDRDKVQTTTGTPTVTNSSSRTGSSVLAMTHDVLPKPEPITAPQSLQSALQMDPQQQQSAQPSRKRKKNDSNDEPSEPRRLRRSHEACARCRSKKIKVGAGKCRRSGDTDGNLHLACNLLIHTTISLSFFSATPSTRDVLHVPTLAHHAIKRTGTGRLSLQEAIPSASSAN